MTIIFDGRKFAALKQERLKLKVEKLKSQGHTPALASIFLPTDPGSYQYTRIKSKAAKSIGMDFISKEIENPKDIDLIISKVRELNDESTVTGILVQKPSGGRDFKNEDWLKIVSAISPQKDIDCLTPHNLGLLMLGKPRFIPATVAAVMAILKESKISIYGKNVVIVGASEILGKPLSLFLTDLQATVTLAHSATSNLREYTKRANILISASGRQGIITPGMVSKKSLEAVIDVGAPAGDVQKEVYQEAKFVSPVPGGVGPVTVVCLLENVISAL